VPSSRATTSFSTGASSGSRTGSRRKSLSSSPTPTPKQVIAASRLSSSKKALKVSQSGRKRTSSAFAPPRPLKSSWKIAACRRRTCSARWGRATRFP
jgi:hypothetical protein